MPKREFVYSAQYYKGGRLDGYYISEKMDGVHAIWDGGISRGLLCTDVPYANTAKDGRYVTPPRATGLWTKYAKPIYAPEEWLDRLPAIALDGELWAGRGQFQKVVSAVRKIVPVEKEWIRRITYNAYNLPYVPYWLADGRIYNAHMDITLKGAREWAARRAEELGIRTLTQSQPFRNAIKILTQYKENDAYKVTQQSFLGTCSFDAALRSTKIFDNIINDGGEGIVLIHGDAHWLPERNKSLLKRKAVIDDEAIVVGYKTGDETDRGSKMLGMCGSLICDWNGREIKVSGLTNELRMLGSTINELSGSDAIEWAINHPAERVPEWIEAQELPRGTTITFKYRELTDNGLPKEARFSRIRYDL